MCRAGMGMDGNESRKGGHIVSLEELKGELTQMEEEFCRENHVGKVKETTAYKDLEAELEKVQRHMEE